MGLCRGLLLAPFSKCLLVLLVLEVFARCGDHAPARRGGGPHPGQLFEKSEWFTRAPASTTTATSGCGHNLPSVAGSQKKAPSWLEEAKLLIRS